MTNCKPLARLIKLNVIYRFKLRMKPDFLPFFSVFSFSGLQVELLEGAINHSGSEFCGERKQAQENRSPYID